METLAQARKAALNGQVRKTYTDIANVQPNQHLIVLWRDKGDTHYLPTAAVLLARTSTGRAKIQLYINDTPEQPVTLIPEYIHIVTEEACLWHPGMRVYDMSTQQLRDWLNNRFPTTAAQAKIGRMNLESLRTARTECLLPYAIHDVGTCHWPAEKSFIPMHHTDNKGKALKSAQEINAAIEAGEWVRANYSFYDDAPKDVQEARGTTYGNLEIKVGGKWEKPYYATAYYYDTEVRQYAGSLAEAKANGYLRTAETPEEKK